MNASAPTARSTSRSGAIVVSLSAAGVVASLMGTLVIPLVAQLPELLDTTAANASWVVTAPLLTGAVATPVFGRLGDLYGKRRLLLTCVALLVAGSLVSALSDSLIPMVIGRAVQGIGMGIVPLGISTMRDVVPPERMGTSVALMSSSLGIGGAFGLPLSAAVAQNTDWHALFWGSAVISALIGLAVARFVPSVPPAARGRFDIPGALGLAAGLVCLLLPVSKGAEWGWTSATTLGLFVAAVVILLAWGSFELRTTDPLVDLRATVRRRVLLTNLASVVIGFAMFAQGLIAPQLLQLPEELGYGLGQSMLAAGLWMVPTGLAMMAFSPLGAKLSARSGPRVSLLTGSLIIAAGYALALPLMGSAPGIMIFSCVVSIGVAFAYGAMPAIIMASVPGAKTAAANGFNALMRSIGLSVASAVVGVILAQMSRNVGGHSVPTENGFRVAAIVGGAAALAAALLTLAIPRTAAPHSDPEETVGRTATEPDLAPAAHPSPAAHPASAPHSSPVAHPAHAPRRHLSPDEKPHLSEGEFT
ncbi:MFS transporter [Streptomyces sp. NPDC088116]|uniref:MFS transporter n=1 Tax=Streptomyces sp. NPDC088116 TaxID=3365825 RepID=UPI00380DEC09